MCSSTLSNGVSGVRAGVAALAILVVVSVGCDRGEAPAVPRASGEQLKKAYTFFTSGQYDQAIALLDPIVQAWPGHTEARERLAYALAALGRFEDVDRILRSAPGDQADSLMSLRRALNIYHYYYAAAEGDRPDVFSAEAIRDALDVLRFDGLLSSAVEESTVLTLGEAAELLQLWSRWDQAARDPDLSVHRQWLPILMVAESDRLKDQIDRLASLEKADDDVWFHPDDQGNWLVHAGVLSAEKPLLTAADQGRLGFDAYTETVESGSGELLGGWREMLGWVGQNVPDARLVVAAGIRPERREPFDRRVALVGQWQGDRLQVVQVIASGMPRVLIQGYGEYRRLLAAKQVVARSSVELADLARVYASLDLSATAFHADDRNHLFAEDRVQLASLLSYLRYGRAVLTPTTTSSTTSAPETGGQQENAAP